MEYDPVLFCELLWVCLAFNFSARWDPGSITSQPQESVLLCCFLLSCKMKPGATSVLTAQLEAGGFEMLRGGRGTWRALSGRGLFLAVVTAQRKRLSLVVQITGGCWKSPAQPLGSHVTTDKLPNFSKLTSLCRGSMNKNTNFMGVFCNKWILI